jgi:phage terminase large subunit-like protein
MRIWLSMGETPGFASQLADALAGDWSLVARPNQLPPPGNWSIWLLLSGRGFGKTRTLSEFANAEATSGRAKRIAIVGSTAGDCRDVLVEGESGILATSPAWCRPVYEPSKRRLTWPNGALATLYSADEPERLRGPQHDAACCDELGSWRHPEAWSNLMLGLRLGKHPRVVVATTPRPTKLIRELVSREGTDVVVSRGTTYENRANLAGAFLSQIIARYENTRLGRQELLGELLLDVPGALWGHAMLEECRREHAPELTRIVVSIDPATTSGDDADETGIIVAGIDEHGRGYVLADLSGRFAPTEWAHRAISAYHSYHADRIVAEVNQGGDMVEATLRMIDRNVSFRSVHASRAKVTRAEPVAALYEQRRIFHIGSFGPLEDQMSSFAPGIFDRKTAGCSFDRVDALVWSFSDLLIQPMSNFGIFELYRQRAAALRIDAAVKPADEPAPEPQPGNTEWLAGAGRGSDRH